MIGYRDNILFGEEYRNPLEVAYYETQILGNEDIPIELLKYSEKFNDEEIKYLQSIINGEVDDIDKQYFEDIIKKVIGNFDYCLWLCSSPKDIYNAYVAPMSGNDDIIFEEYIDNITAYEIPDNAIILSDLGKEGRLYCFDHKDLVLYNKTGQILENEEDPEIDF